MIKKAVTVAILGTCLIPAAFATSFFNKLGMDQLKNEAPAVMSAKAAVSKTHYTDFSGNWTGSCSMMDGTTGVGMTLAITNDANKITINGEEIVIGGFFNASYTKSPFAIDEHVMLNWTNNGTVLSADGILIARLNAPVLTKIITTKITMARADNQLLLKGTITSESDHVNGEVSCTLSPV